MPLYQWTENLVWLYSNLPLALESRAMDVTRTRSNVKQSIMSCAIYHPNGIWACIWLVFGEYTQPEKRHVLHWVCRLFQLCHIGLQQSWNICRPPLQSQKKCSLEENDKEYFLRSWFFGGFLEALKLIALGRWNFHRQLPRVYGLSVNAMNSESEKWNQTPEDGAVPGLVRIIES